MREPGRGPGVEGERRRAIALAALFAGAIAIATSALFVRASETGPIATGFWRVALAAPFFWAWLLFARGVRAAPPRAEARSLAAAGLFFAGDLAVWHWAIVLTSIANATLLANLAPIFVALAVWALYGRRPAPLFLSGLALALGGMVVLLGADLRRAGAALAGDALGVLTAMFYAAYQITVTRLRARMDTVPIMAWSGLVVAAALLPLALATGEPILPRSAQGWATLLGLALVAQLAGQSLIAYAMAHLPATFSSVGLLVQPVAAAALAWALFGERLGPAEVAGGLVVLAGIRAVQRAELGAPARA